MDQWLDYRYIVRQEANRILRRNPRLPARDLLQSGLLALWQCSQRYDPERGVPFYAFCRPRIRGAIVDGLREDTRFVSRARPLAALQGKLNWDSMEAFRDFESTNSMEARQATALLRPLLRQLVMLLPENERNVVNLRYWDGLNSLEIGPRLRITPSRARQLHVQAIRRLRGMFGLSLTLTRKDRCHEDGVTRPRTRSHRPLLVVAEVDPPTLPSPSGGRGSVSPARHVSTHEESSHGRHREPVAAF